MVRGCPIPGEFVFFHWSITIESRHPSGSIQWAVDIFSKLLAHSQLASN